MEEEGEEEEEEEDVVASALGMDDSCAIDLSVMLLCVCLSNEEGNGSGRVGRLSEAG